MIHVIFAILNSTLFVFLFALGFFCGGCAGTNCIKIGGSYDRASGNIEYCWDHVKSQDLQKPVLVSSQGETYLGITTSDALQILEIAEDSFVPGAKAKASMQDAFKKLVALLMKQ